jgi:hypothetical protein
LDSPAAVVAAEADDADICTILQINMYRYQNGEFLLAARHFSPRGVANSQFWLHSRTHKLSPNATMLPKP